MPPLAELVLVALYALLLLWPVAGLAGRQRHPMFAPVYVVAALLTLAALLALGVVRWPLIPAVALLTWWEIRAVRIMSGILPPEPDLRARRLAAGIVLPLVVVAIALPTWLLPRVPPAAPTGPFPVGAADLVWTDNARVDLAGQPRQLSIRLWFPGEDAPDLRPLGRHPEPARLERDLVAALPGSHGPWIVRALTRAADPIYREMRLSTRQRRYSVLILDHGLPGAPALLTELGAELASRGYLVVAPAHPGWSLGTPGDDAATIPPGRWGIAEEEVQQAPAEWIADSRFVLGEVQRLAALDRAGDGPRFAGRLLLDRIGWVGQGIGALAGAALTADSTLAVLIALDPPPSFAAAAVGIPLMVLARDGAGNAAEPEGFVRVTIPGAGPADFTGLARWSPVLLRRYGLGGRVPADRMAALLGEFSAAFFDVHLKHEPAERLRGLVTRFRGLSVTGF